jgi:hypothetical protein
LTVTTTWVLVPSMLVTVKVSVGWSLVVSAWVAARELSSV